jgi:hypothetical protein
MRRLAAALGRHRTLVFNENLDHVRLHPRPAFSILRHMIWRTGNLIRCETRPGGWLYTQVWRLLHPSSLIRPIVYRLAVRAGARAAGIKSRLPRTPSPLCDPLPAGISVVIPSRNGRDLLEQMLPALLADLAGRPSEVLVADNGSTDGTAEWLSSTHPGVLCDVHPSPLGFAPAVNRGIRPARFAHLCLLNNDMEIRPGFFDALLDAFSRVPGPCSAPPLRSFSPTASAARRPAKPFFTPPASRRISPSAAKPRSTVRI